MKNRACGMLHPYLRQQGGVDRAERIGGEFINEANSPLFRKRNFPLSFPERGPVWREQQVFQQQSFIITLNLKNEKKGLWDAAPLFAAAGRG